MAQWIARWTSDPEVVGSSPTAIVFIFHCYFETIFGQHEKCVLIIYNNIHIVYRIE